MSILDQLCLVSVYYGTKRQTILHIQLNILYFIDYLQ